MMHHEVGCSLTLREGDDVAPPGPDFDLGAWSDEELSFDVGAPIPECRDLASAALGLHRRFRVRSVVQGTLADQERRLRRFAPTALSAALAPLLRAAGWRAWCPAADAPAWRWLWRSFERFEATFGEVPALDELAFFDRSFRVAARPDGPSLERADENLAVFGAGTMAVYRGAETHARAKPLPAGRSEFGAPAPLFALAAVDGFAFYVVHVLAHGLAEMHPDGRAHLEDFKLLAGWVDGALYDAGSREVDAIGPTLRLPTTRRISATTWNDGWAEQPITQYSTVHAVEDFAESAAAYALAPRLLALRAPRRSAFFEQRFPR